MPNTLQDKRYVTNMTDIYVEEGLPGYDYAQKSTKKSAFNVLTFFAEKKEALKNYINMRMVAALMPMNPTVQTTVILPIAVVAGLPACEDKNEVDPKIENVKFDIVTKGLGEILGSADENGGIIEGGSNQNKSISSNIPKKFDDAMKLYAEIRKDSLEQGLTKIRKQMKQNPGSQFTIRKSFSVESSMDSLMNGFQDPFEKAYFEGSRSFGSEGSKRTLKEIFDSYMSRYQSIIQGSVNDVSTSSTPSNIEEIADAFTVTFSDYNNLIGLEDQLNQIVYEITTNGEITSPTSTVFLVVYVMTHLVEEGTQ